MKLLVIAGEVSGDQHGAGLIRALKKQDEKEIRVFGIGGDNLAAEGMELMYHISQMAFLGIGEIIRHLPFIRKVHHSVLERAANEKPDCAVLIDYPGFNLKIAAGLHKLNIPVIYYISPQLWAWGRRRIEKIKKYVNLMLVLFPFEEKFYKDYGIDAICVGHPLVDKHHPFLPVKDKELNPGHITIGLLPGSRKQEIQSLLPKMIAAAEMLFTAGKIHQAEIIRVNHIPESEYQKYLKPDMDFITVKTEPLPVCLPRYDAALVASGTATLETGYYALPMVIVYMVNKITYFLGRLLVKVPFIGLVNIVAGSQVSVELIQQDCTPEKMVVEIEELLSRDCNKKTRANLKIIREKLGPPGASDKAAKVISGFLKNMKNGPG
ncbi:MAG: lipid-A-disaccharide synthase [Calditrichaceae bacterium]|nr:lipid-A-disaccharide synthase [Calditrichaceae bacterium]MBN2707430.1 lipid-A-disaccharide synthase [Calditrichaceae bacterium]RQV93998.1 MAG: lipid-A-disaccharide synthase [Calditrichota bacterium]